MAQDFHLRLITQRASGGDPIVRERRVPGPELSVGRATDNAVVLADLAVELHHARIRIVGPGRLQVEGVSGATFEHNGRATQRADLSLASKPELRFGDYSLAFDEGEDGGVAVVVTREEPDHAANPSIFSLRAKVFGRRRMAWIFGATIFLLCLLVPLFATDVLRGAKIHPDQQWSTGPLSKTHAFLETNCGACHQKAFVAVRDDACLSCHMNGAPAVVAKAEETARADGSPFRPTLISEHAALGADPVEAHRRLNKAGPPLKGGQGISEKIQAAFGHPTDRCASCHIEHNAAVPKAGTTAAAADRAEKPTLIVQRDCETCHTSLKSRLTDTKLIDTPDWGKHPKFRPQVTRGGKAEALPARLWIASNPKEETGLIFPHDLHLDPLGGPARQAVGLRRTHAGASPVTCASCHIRQGTGFKPVTMEESCEACHSLAFTRNSTGKLVSLPHEEPAKVKAFLDANYGGGGGIFRAAFQANGMCVDCHTITWNGAMPVVAPVHLAQSFMPRSEFDHSRVQHGGKSADEMVCRDCHRSTALRANPAAPKWRVSSNASDLLQPDKAQCDTCHGNVHAKKDDSAPVDCKTCHSFHAPARAACEPNERGLAALAWDAKQPAMCVKPRRYAAGFKG